MVQALREPAVSLGKTRVNFTPIQLERVVQLPTAIEFHQIFKDESGGKTSLQRYVRLRLFHGFGDNFQPIRFWTRLTWPNQI